MTGQVRVESAVPVTQLKNNPAKVIEQTSKAHRPVLLTSRGRGVAVVQSLEDFEKTQEELALVKAIARGVSELDAGEGLAAAEVHARYGLK